MEEKKPVPNQINIELPEQTAEGTYANLAVISHSSSEFVIDFVRMMPGIPKAKVQSRIILTPEHAKRLQNALKENIAKYESIFGPVKIPEGNVPHGIPMTFSGPAGEA